MKIRQAITNTIRTLILPTAVGLFFPFGRCISQVSVLTNHNDVQRTGTNLSETVLNTSNVNKSNFGKLWTYAVGGQIYAQPLYVAGVNIPGKGSKNVLYVADMHNEIFAFDADDLSMANSPYWKVDYGHSVPLPDSKISSLGYTDIHVEIGIMSTPVIDTSTNTIYFVTKTKVGAVFADSLHALDLSTGLPKFGGSQLIAATVSGTGDGSTTVKFVSNRQNQRSALLLVNGVVYISYASYGDTPPYHGWIFGYNASNINQQSIIFNLNPNGQFGGIWMSGAGPSADSSGNIYVVTGNGQTGVQDLGESFLKLSPDLIDNTLTVSDYFTPYNQDSLDIFDVDLGTSAALLIPNSTLIVSSGKEGVVYLVDANNMGHFHSGSNSSADQILQEFKAFGGQLMGTPVIWGDSIANANTALTYWWSENDVLTAYRLNYNTQQFDITPFAKGLNGERPLLPGAILSLSANGHTAGTGILWASFPIGNANPSTVGGVLRAFNANNLAEIWNSSQMLSRDSLGSFAKFVPPTIVNGRVYMATFSGTVNVYGLLSALPVVYQDFSASRQNSIVDLQWTTSSEQNNGHFEVLRSEDGSNFVKIGSVPGHLNSYVLQNYSFDDQNPFNGRNYYRLKQVDLDGHASYSSILSINMDLVNNIYFHVFPNPAHDQVSIGCNGLASGSMINVSMFNSGGSLVYRQIFAPGSNGSITINRSASMYSGVYYIRITLPSGETKEERLIWGN
jgi:Secretion system C-terminal sorting domain/PQQ-like domain